MTIDAEGIERLENTLADARSGKLTGFVLISQHVSENAVETELSAGGKRHWPGLFYALGEVLCTHAVDMARKRGATLQINDAEKAAQPDSREETQ